MRTKVAEWKIRWDELKGRIGRHPLVKKAIDWSKTNSLPGLKGIPIFNLVVFIDKETQKDALITRANSMAFSFIMAIFPAIIVLFTLLAYTPLYDEFDEVLNEYIADIMPGNAGQMVMATIKDIATIPRSGWLSFGFLLALWFASNGMLSMMRGLEKEYPVTFKQRTPFQKRLIALQLTALIGLVLVGSVLLVVMGEPLLYFLFTYIQADYITRILLFSFRWVTVIVLFYAIFSTIYRYGSSVRKPIPFFSVGASVGTFLSISSSYFFSFYVDHFGSYNKLYGSIGTLIVLMVWMQLNCLILLIGFELNAGIAVLRDIRKSAI
jgi:membrane protein